MFFGEYMRGLWGAGIRGGRRSLRGFEMALVVDEEVDGIKGGGRLAK